MTHAELPADAGKGHAGKETHLACVTEEGSSTGNTFLSDGYEVTRLFLNMCTRRAQWARTRRGTQVCASPSTAWVTDNFRASAPHTRDTTGSLRPQAAPGGGTERGAVTRRPRGWRGRRDTEGTGRQLPSLSTTLCVGLRALSSIGPSGSSLHP